MNRKGLTILFVFINLAIYGFAMYSLVFKGQGKERTNTPGAREVSALAPGKERVVQGTKTPLTSPMSPPRSPFQSIGYGGPVSAAVVQSAKPGEVPAFKLKGYMADAKDSSAIIEFDIGGSQTVKKNDRIGVFLVIGLASDSLVVENVGRKYRVTSDSVEEIK